MIVRDLYLMNYRDAWVEQECAHESVLNGGEPQLLLVEHPPVITLGRRGETEGPKHLRALPATLAKMGVELIQSDRGGDITFHGPGQLVAYPIVKLSNYKLMVGGFVRALEEVVIRTLKSFEVVAEKDDHDIGVWTQNLAGQRAKIAALGIRVRRGVSMHGIALNVSTDLDFFKLIIPCGLTEKAVTSMQEILGPKTPAMDDVKERMIDAFKFAFPQSTS